MKKVIFICMFLLIFLSSCKTKKPKLHKLTLENEFAETIVIETSGDYYLEELTHDGYVFLGWEYNYQMVNSINVKEDVTVVAKWLKKGIKRGIFYIYDFNASLDKPISSYNTGDSFELPIPTLKNNEFMGWFKDDNFSDGPYYRIQESDNEEFYFYAKFKDVSIRKKINYVAKDATISDKIDEYIVGEEYDLPLARKEGYFFKGWYLNSDFSGEQIRKVTSSFNDDITLYANFKEIDFEETNVSIFGDSISTFEGYLVNNNPTYYPYPGNTVDVKSVEQTWWHQAISKLHLNLCVNGSCSGIGLNTQPKNVLSDEMINSLKNTETPDIILVFLGINDCKVSLNETAFKAKYEELINKLKDSYYGVELVLFTLPYSNFSTQSCYALRDKYNVCIKELSEKYNTGLVELDKVITKENNYLNMANYLHPNSKGMTLIANATIQEFRRYFLGL